MTFSFNFRQFSMSAATIAIAAVLTASPAAQSGGKNVATQPIVPAVAVARLAPLLPTMPGWTKGVVDADVAVISPTCSYTYAYALYTNAGATIRVTVADTGFDPGGLGATATMVVTFPDGYSGQIPPSTSITRLMFKGWPAATLTDSTSGEGEFTVVVGGRFVVRAEGKKLPSPDLVLEMVNLVNLNALSALK